MSKKTKAAKAPKIPKIIRSVVMRLTADEAARLLYQRKFDAAYARELQSKAPAVVQIEHDTRTLPINFDAVEVTK